MIKNYLVVSLALLAIVPFLVLDVTAQTLTISTPTGFPNAARTTTQANHLVIDHTTTTATLQGNGWRYAANVDGIGEIYVPTTKILSNPVFSASTDDDQKRCTFALKSVKNLVSAGTISGFAAPSNIQPNQLANITALGFRLAEEFTGGSGVRCPVSLHATSQHPLITEKELRIMIYDKDGKTPYFFSPRDGVTAAKLVPACTTSTIHTSNQTLKGDTIMCYGKNGNDLVIVTKRLAFYGAADSVSAPIIDPTSRDNVTGIGSLTASLFDITTIGAGKGSIDTDGKYTYAGGATISKSPTPSGHIYIPSNAIISSSAFVAADAGKTCAKGQVLPSDYSASVALPAGVSNITAYGFGSSNAGSCVMSPVELGKQQRDVDKVLQVVLYDQAGKHGYFYDRSRNITTAQYIAPCDDGNNFDNATKMLRNNVKMCYADVGTDLVVYTKVMQFYGANETPLDPPTPDPTDPPLPAGTIKIPPPSDFPSGEPGSDHIRLVGLSQNYDQQTAKYRPHAFPDPGDDTIKRVATAKPRVGEVFVPGQITLLTNPLHLDVNLSFGCNDIFLTNLTNSVTIPNIQPTSPIGLGFVFESDLSTSCKTLYDLVSDYPVFIDKELRFTLYDKHDKKPYYISPRDNMTQAQPITACSSTNFDTDDQALKGDTKMCYGVNGTNMVIITKRFGGFYGVADTVTAPTNPLDLDSTSPSTAVTISRQDVSDINSIDTFNITSGSLGPGYSSAALLDTHGKHTFAAAGTTQKGHIYISPTTIISTHPNTGPFKSSDSNKDCVRGHVVSTAHADHNLPKDVSEGIAYGFAYTNGTDTCNYNSNSMDRQFDVGTPLRIVLYDQAGKQAYSYLPAANITTSQNITKCSSTNLDDSTKIPLGSTKQCYENVGDDLVIYSEVMQWYGAKTTSTPGTTTPTPPTPPGTTVTTSRDNVKGIGTNPLSDGLFNITTSAAGNGSIDPSGKYSYVVGGAKQKGHIYIPSDTVISDALFVAADVGKTCVQGHVISSDYSPSFSRPSDVSDGTAYGFAGIAGPDSDTCTLKLSHLAGQLNTSKTFQVVLYDQAGKVGYYYHRSIGINTAQDIAACSNTNFDDTTKTLKGTTRYCYKAVGGDLVIYAKVIQMYGAKTAGDTGADINTVSRDDVYGIGVNTNFNITTSAAGNGSIDTFGKYTWSAVGTQPKGHIYIPPDTIISDALFVADDVGKTCMQGRVIPSDYSSIISRPSDVSDGTAYGFLYLVGADSDTCTLKNTAFIGQFNTSNTLQVVLYDQAGKEGYYYHPGVNITTSQDMTECSSTIFDDTTKTFKGTTKHCYADVGDDLVIYTKVLLWYGAKTPSTPDLLSIPKPSNFPQLQPVSAYLVQAVGDYDTTTKITTYRLGSSEVSLNNLGGLVIQNRPNGTIGNLYLAGSLFLYNYTVTVPDMQSSHCSMDLWSLSDLITKDLVPSFNIPDNVSPNDSIIGLGFDFNATQFGDPCKTDIENSDEQVNPSLDLRFTIYNSTGKQPYYFSPRENIVQAQPIDPCTTDTIYTSNYTLKNTTEMCYGKDGKDLVILTKRLAFYGVEGSGDDGNSDSTDDDGDMANAPTFGTSPLTGEQLVTCGYKMDDTCRDITAYHVQYERDVIQTNTTHTFALKALAPNMIDSFTLAFGVPEIGSPVSAAEAYITAKLAVNYTSPSYYNIIQVTVHDPNNIIDYDIANTEIARVSCSGGTLECAQVTFPDVLFRETLYHEPFVVMITDTLLYTSINYMNEGILVTGAPLNEQPTISPGITVDTGDTRPTKLVLVRTDKVNDLWADAFGNTWSRNSFGNYVIVEYAPYAGTVPVCSDINDRLCAPFKAKLDWHNQRMIELRDSLYTAYTTEAYAEIDNIFAYEFGDMDSRTRTLINLGWLTE